MHIFGGVSRHTISIHAPHEGERHPAPPDGYTIQEFQSTLPTRGSDNLTSAEGRLYAISIHAPHEGERRPNPPPIQGGGEFQSTLPTRGSDYDTIYTVQADAYFNPRSPRGGATDAALVANLGQHIFQSTLPTRGSDLAGGHKPPHGQRISIHAPHEGERRLPACRRWVWHTISIHAPHEGERLWVMLTYGAHRAFQSTLPTRGSDCQLRPASFPARFISIHAPHEGERQADIAHDARRKRISIHAPHEGERLPSPYAKRLPWDFNPRSPRGGATARTR